MHHHHNNHSNNSTGNAHENNKTALLNNLSTFNKQEAKGNGHIENGHDSNKIASERHEKEKPVVKAKPKELDGYVGFANLPNQVYRKAVKKGFEFTLMVVGELRFFLLKALKCFTFAKVMSFDFNKLFFFTI